MPLPGSTTFTEAAVQRAMNEWSAKWGAPPGYYSVQRRVRKPGPGLQVWTVRVRLFGGRIRHEEEVLFKRLDDAIDGPITYAGPLSTIELPTVPSRPRAPRPKVFQSEEEKADYISKQQECKLRHQEASEGAALMHRTRWTQSEDRTLQEDLSKGIPLDITARKLGRTYYASSQRRVVLGVAPRRKVTAE